MNDDIKSRFATLAADHRATLGVTWSVMHLTGRTWWFGGFSRQHDALKGNGAIALRAVAALADELRVRLTLMTSRPRLVPYYQAHGFRTVGPINQYAANMQREPTRVIEL